MKQPARLKPPTFASLLAISLLLPAGCASMAPVAFDPDRVAYAILDEEGNPKVLCFDTISPNNCVSDPDDNGLKKYGHKSRILVKHYLLLLEKPSQIDCNIRAPNECRVYFEHIHVDIDTSREEIDKIQQELQGEAF